MEQPWNLATSTSGQTGTAGAIFPPAILPRRNPQDLVRIIQAQKTSVFFSPLPFPFSLCSPKSVPSGYQAGYFSGGSVPPAKRQEACDFLATTDCSFLSITPRVARLARSSAESIGAPAGPLSGEQ
ncbi:hypothetical protein RRG08_066237 [Elysia crispata]|uniref:Uncharacterized protein n=1 Tax=Elysia crispata TaxID=231223 RepID=A0AAE1EDZ8_9GAST|nr:hypothetical protein RRG08_066237 [Elysia crispata]